MVALSGSQRAGYSSIGPTPPGLLPQRQIVSPEDTRFALQRQADIQGQRIALQQMLAAEDRRRIQGTVNTGAQALGQHVGQTYDPVGGVRNALSDAFTSPGGTTGPGPAGGPQGANYGTSGPVTQGGISRGVAQHAYPGTELSATAAGPQARSYAELANGTGGSGIRSALSLPNLLSVPGEVTAAAGSAISRTGSAVSSLTGSAVGAGAQNLGAGIEAAGGALSSGGASLGSLAGSVAPVLGVAAQGYGVYQDFARADKTARAMAALRRAGGTASGQEREKIREVERDFQRRNPVHVGGRDRNSIIGNEIARQVIYGVPILGQVLRGADTVNRIVQNQR